MAPEGGLTYFFLLYPERTKENDFFIVISLFRLIVFFIV